MAISAGIWIILIGALVAGSCSLAGCFLVLRRMAMLGDAISHAVLPGIALAFLWSSSRAAWPMFVGATVLGLLTAFIVQLLNKGGRVQSDAAIGVTFTSLFAFGVVLVSLYAGQIDLDQECVLYGEIAYAAFESPFMVAGRDLGPQPFWQMLAIFVLCLGTISLLFKELKIAAFDPEMATAAGINVTLMHYVLMALVSVTTVGSFTLVGAILVVAMLVVPAATAYLLTDDLKKMLVISVLCGVLSSTFGYLVAQRMDVSIAGSMTVVAGVLFALAFVFSPRHGVLIKWLSQQRLSARIGREDALQVLWRHGESAESNLNLDATGVAALTHNDMNATRGALQNLRRSGLVEEQKNGARGFVLTQSGRAAAQEMVHRHRVYETYLGDLGYPQDHVHAAADRTEHFLSPQMVETIDDAAGNPQVDPHGKPIPHDNGK